MSALSVSIGKHRVFQEMARWCSRLARQPVTLEVDGSSPFRVAIFEKLSVLLSFSHASVAQLVEQGTENPRVVGSIPTGGTTNDSLRTA